MFGGSSIISGYKDRITQWVRDFFPLCFVGSENPGPLDREVGILSQYLPRFYPSRFLSSVE